jgi:hypothetical protein
MKLIAVPRTLALAGSAAAITLAGCASVTAAHGSPGASLAGTTTTASPAALGSPQQCARAEAASMLEAFAAPPGGRPVAATPVPSSELSTLPAGSSRPSDNDVVTGSAWWLAPGDPQRLLSWETAHIRAPYRLSGYGTVAKGIWSDDYMIAAVPGLFDFRDLTVSVTAAGHGQTAIRVDSVVDWIPVRPAGDTVPATAKVAVITESKGSSRHPPVVAAKTLTSPEQVAKLAAYLNGLPADPPGGRYSCPAASGGELTIVFRARPGGPVLAKARAGLSGCAFLSYTMPGRPETGLGGGDAGQGLLAQINHVAGLHWTVPR